MRQVMERDVVAVVTLKDINTLMIVMISVETVLVTIFMIAMVLQRDNGKILERR